MFIDWLIDWLTWERDNHQFVVPLTDAFIGWFLYVPWPEMEPITLMYRGDTLTSGAPQPGHPPFHRGRNRNLDSWVSLAYKAATAREWTSSLLKQHSFCFTMAPPWAKHRNVFCNKPTRRYLRYLYFWDCYMTSDGNLSPCRSALVYLT